MNSKPRQYLMKYSDIGVTLNIYRRLGLEDAAEELVDVIKELGKVKGENLVS